MKIYLARHGQNEDNANGILNGHRDLALTQQGKKQAQELANLIKGHHLCFDAILSSPLQRAHQTAETIRANIDGPEIETLDLLIERDFGIMTGVEQSRIKELCAPDTLETDTVTYFLSPEGAETFDDLMSRAGNIIQYVTSHFNPGQSILLVGHGDLEKMIHAYYYGLSWQDGLTQFHFGNSDLVLLSEDTSAEKSKVFEIKQFNT